LVPAPGLGKAEARQVTWLVRNGAGYTEAAGSALLGITS
jgi:hypothetical protein